MGNQTAELWWRKPHWKLDWLHITFMTTNPNCPPNSSNLTAFPHFFVSLQNDYFKPLPFSSSRSHPPRSVTSLHVSWSKYKPSHRKSLIFHHHTCKPPCFSTNFLLFPSSWNGKRVFPPTQAETLLWGVLSLWPSQGLHSVTSPSLPPSSSLYFYPAVSISLKICPRNIYFQEKRSKPSSLTWVCISSPFLYFSSQQDLSKASTSSATVHFSISYILSSDPTNLPIFRQSYQHYHGPNLAASSPLSLPAASDKLKHSRPEILGMLWVSKHSGLYFQGKR